MKTEHILIIRFSALGDVAMTVPVVAALAQQYPEVRITMLSREFVRPLFEGLAISDNTLTLFTEANANAVTGISTWTTTTGFETLATAESVNNGTLTTIADFPAGTDCNGTVLSQRLIMIGVSEYSTAFLSEDGKRLIENAICLLAGITERQPQGVEQTETHPSSTINHKFLYEGQLYIQSGYRIFDITGRPVQL